MSGPHQDDELLAALGEALREVDAVPPRVTATGRGLFSLYTLDAELAELSAQDKELAGVRSAPSTARELDFTTGELTIHVELTGRQLSGQVVPPQPGEINLQTVDGPPQRVDVDELGWFTVVPAPQEGFRLLFLASGGAHALTGWIAIA